MPAGTDPFGGGGDEEADEALEPVLDVKTRYFFANLRKKSSLTKAQRTFLNFFNLYVFLFGIINLLFDDEGYSYKCRLNFSDHFKLLSFWGKS